MSCFLSTTISYVGIFAHNNQCGFTAVGESNGGYVYQIRTAFSDNSISWYFPGISDDGEEIWQLNKSGNRYYYMAITA